MGLGGVSDYRFQYLPSLNEKSAGQRGRRAMSQRVPVWKRKFEMGIASVVIAFVCLTLLVIWISYCILLAYLS